MTLTGHLVLELVKLPPPSGEEERPGKVVLEIGQWDQV